MDTVKSDDILCIFILRQLNKKIVSGKIVAAFTFIVVPSVALYYLLLMFYCCIPYILRVQPGRDKLS